MRRLRQCQGDGGMGLPELLVSMVVFGILAGAVVATMSSTLGFFRGTSAHANDLNGAQVAVDAMAKALQTAAQPPVASGTPAPAIISAGPTDLSFYAYDNPGMGPSQIRFFVDSARNLVEQRTPASNCTPPFSYGSVTHRVLAKGVAVGSTVFSYLAPPSTASPTGSPLATVGNVLPTVSAGQVEMVNINLNLSGTTLPGVSSTGVTTTVTLLNHLVSATSVPDNAC